MSANAVGGVASSLRELLYCLPQVLATRDLGYHNLFCTSSFNSSTIRPAKHQESLHPHTPNGERLMTFDTYNMFYRDTLEVPYAATTAVQGYAD